ncbi:MAG: murein biosynthesis integral membrane protein MurJ [Deltaproteobacteria bacterium]|nr:murein biosynthesis integral membrane protein MurJ [Deltaproteobacteria bacterium]
MSKFENMKVARAAGVVGGATLFSRILGVIRDMIIACFFGAGGASDAFFVAFRIPNLFRRLFAEGSLSIAFIPVFMEYLARQGKDEDPMSGQFSLTVTLTRIMFPYLFFIGLVALCMGILNSLGHFAAPAFAPVFLNVAIIGSALLISPHLNRPVIGLGAGVLIGGMLQLLLQIPFLLSEGLIFWKAATFCHAGIKKVGRLMLPAIFGTAVYQINILAGTLLASFLGEGSVSYLYYADRLVQFPLGIFAIATATAIMPTLSRQAMEKKYEALNDTIAYGLNLVLFITVPSMVGLMVLNEPIVALLFERGAFDAESTRQTAAALFYYGMGLWAFSAVRIVVSIFYALQDSRTPVKTGIVSVAVNISLGIILMKSMGHCGIALSASIASMINLILLVTALVSRIGFSQWRCVMLSACKTLTGSAIMGFCVWLMARWIIPASGKPLAPLFWGLSGCVVFGVAVYAVSCYALKSTELKNLGSRKE